MQVKGFSILKFKILTLEKFFISQLAEVVGENIEEPILHSVVSYSYNFNLYPN